MIRRFAAGMLMVLPLVVCGDARTRGNGGGPGFPTTAIFFANSTPAIARAVLLPTLSGGVSGVGYIVDGRVPPVYASSINAAGASTMVGLGGYAAQWAQGYSADNAPCGRCWASLKGTISKSIANGARAFYVDEPNNGAPGYPDTCSAGAIAFDVAGFNIVYGYIKSIDPSVRFGIVQNGYGKSTCAPSDAIGWHMAHLKAGMREDFAAQEQYNQICCGPQTTSPWQVDGWTYDAVEKMELIYSVATLCAYQYINYSNIDIVAFWDVDLFGHFIGPLMDPMMLPAALRFAATGDKSLYCKQNHSQDRNPTWDTQFGPSFTRAIEDSRSYPNWRSPYAILSCDYRVLSGANAVNGFQDPSVVVTRDWTPRTCNSTISITAGAGGECRDEVSEPIAGSISGTTLTVTGGAVARRLQIGTGIFGAGVASGTRITALGTGRGGRGTYIVNYRQTASPTRAALGVKTCLVEVRAHNNSPGGLGNPTYQEFSIAY